MTSSRVPTHTETSGNLVRIASIDGLRAIAILLVILDHYPNWLLPDSGQWRNVAWEATEWAASGVDLFFVLSGFLITGILVDSKGLPNYFARFYWRRTLRIFPAYYAFLTPLLFFHTFFTGITPPWFIFYLRNWRGADAASDGILGHLWSLAVEEQFYIGWSIIVFLVAARWLPHVTVTLIALAPVVRAVMGQLGYPGYEIFRVTPARMDSLLIGALVALAVRSSWKDRLSDAARFGLLASIGGLILIRLTTGPLNIDNHIVQIGVPFLIPVLYASTLTLCLKAPPHGVSAAVLGNPFFRVVAKYSYAIYLFHLVSGQIVLGVYWLMVNRFPAMKAPLTVLFIPAAFAFVFSLAAVSWRYIEAQCCV